MSALVCSIASHFSPLFILGFAVLFLWLLTRRIGLPWIGTVTHFADGDSIEAKAWMHTYRVRIRGIDAPEYKQPYGKVARLALVERMGNRRALFIPFGADCYGRWLCWVFTAQGCVSWSMVSAGHAWPASLPTYLLHIPARLFKRGLWADTFPLHPSVYRHSLQRRAFRR